MKSCKGHALLSVVAILGALLVAGVATVRMTQRELHGTAVSVARQKALYVAEAGVQRAIARLSQDRTTASTSTAYTFSESNQAIGEGIYSVNVVQDPLFATEPSRKRVTGVGTALNQQATVVAQVHVQDTPASSTICFADLGTCRIQSLVSLGAVNPLWTGDIFSNEDAAIEVLVGAVVRAGNTAGVPSRIYARDRFTDAAVNIGGVLPIGAPILSNTTAELRAGQAYSPTALIGGLGDIHLALPLIPINPLGLHFANGTNGHGVTEVIAKRPFPKVDWESLQRDEGMVIVNAANVPSGTSWDAASETWVVGSLVDDDVKYYVEGNVHITSLQLLNDAEMTIAARGWSVVESLSVVNAGLLANGQQDVRIIAEDDNTIGLDLVSYSPLTLQSTTAALAGAGVATAPGIGLNVASVATTNRVFAYSETGDVWAKTSTISALSTTRFSAIAKSDATIAFTAGVANGIRTYQ